MLITGSISNIHIQLFLLVSVYCTGENTTLFDIMASYYSVENWRQKESWDGC